MGFWRNFFRRTMNPLDPGYAMKMRNRLQALYFFGAWNLFALVVYAFVKKTDLTDVREGENTAQYYSRLLSKHDTTILRYTGTTFNEKVQIPNTEKPEGIPWMKKRREELEAKKKSLELSTEETNGL